MGDTRRHLQADRASGHDAVGMQRAVREDRHRLAFEMTEPRERLRRRALVAQAAVDVEGLPLASQHLGIECRLAVEGLRVRSLEQIGRASCRERVGKYVWISGVAVEFKKKKKQ